MVDLKAQYNEIKSDIDNVLLDVIASTAFINGQPVKDLANNLAEYLNVEHVIPCGNGTDALQIALMAFHYSSGDEVITTPFTFVATAEVIALLGLRPVFVDIEPGTFNIDVSLIHSAITSKTKCIIPVHLFGQSADMESINNIASDHGVHVIEDNAQSIGAEYTFTNGETMKTGGIGEIGCMSFYPSKNLGAYGDGGAITTNDGELADKIRKICDHGSDKKYRYDVVGVNSRLDTLQAAILGIKLKKIDEYNRKRSETAGMYDRALKDIPGIEVPTRSENSSHVFHQYTIRVSSGRDELKQYLGEKGVPSMIYYPEPLHLCNAYKTYDYQPGDFPESERASREVLSLPMHPNLTTEQIEYIIESIQTYSKKHDQ